MKRVVEQSEAQSQSLLNETDANFLIAELSLGAKGGSGSYSWCDTRRVQRCTATCT